MNEIAILIPCYNEAMTIGNVIDTFKNQFKDAPIYVYDNNSTDDTVRIAEKKGAIIGYEHKQGKGNVIRRMFREIDAKCYIMIDGDDAFNPIDAVEMSKLILEKKYDMVIGDRLSSNYFSTQKRLFHGIGNRLVRFLVNLIFGCNIKDIMSGYRALSYNFVKTYPVLAEKFELETEMSIHAAEKRMSIFNYPVEFKERPDGSVSSMNTFTDGICILKTIFSLFIVYKPFIFFSILSIILFVLASYFFIPVLIFWKQTASVPNFPRLIVCCFVYVTSIISFFSGLILESINKTNKQNFEFEFIKTQKNGIN